MDFLTTIVESKKKEIEIFKGEKRSFLKNLEKKGTNIIAEIKRASPSKGSLNENLDVKSLSLAYEEGGACAISVLTEKNYFKGSIDDLKTAKENTKLPILRKDFIVSSYQIYESLVIGADAILLIVRILSKEKLKKYLNLCNELGLDALVEVNSENDIEIAKWAQAKIIGINNRDLKTFDTNIETAVKMVSLLEPYQIPVAASGIQNKNDIEKIKEAGINNFLIGESLVKSLNPKAFLKELQGVYTPQVKICGLKTVEDALKCAELGADAIGLVFYDKSHRFVTDIEAKNICQSLPEKIISVGVFVDENFSFIMGKVKFCGLKAVQLHGQESNELIKQLKKEGVIVIKGLFMEKEPLLEKASEYQADSYLVECGKGDLPGGNALSWDWEKTRDFSAKSPLILAGGLTPENVTKAAASCLPDAVDVSSGVEEYKGKKDISKVKKFMEAISQCNLSKSITRRIF